MHANILQDLFQNACKIGENNLRMQREILFSWSRLWPAMLSRQYDSPTPFAQMHGEWSTALQDLAKKQRDWLDQEFDVAFKSFNSAFAGGRDTNGSSLEEPAKSPATEQLKEVPAPAPLEQPPNLQDAAVRFLGPSQNIAQKVAVVTGAASGIGEAVARDLAHRGVRAVIMVDRSEQVLDVVKSINKAEERDVALGQIGDTTDAAFRKRVFNEATEKHGVVSICVPAAGITRDALAVRIDKETGKAEQYPVDSFRQVTEVNLIAPIYWAIEMIARIAEDRRQNGLKRWEPEETIQGVVVFLGSVSSQGNKGQLSYAVAKAGLEGAAATLTKEAMFHGVRCGIIHPGFTDTPMARSLGKEFLDKNVLPYTQLRRLIRSDEIADAICFMISNSAVSGELWADAGWHGPA